MLYTTLKALCHYIVRVVTKNNDPPFFWSNFSHAHTSINIIAKSVTNFSHCKQLNLRDFSTVEKNHYGVECSSSPFLRMLCQPSGFSESCTPRLKTEEGKAGVYKELGILALQ